MLKIHRINSRRSLTQPNYFCNTLAIEMIVFRYLFCFLTYFGVFMQVLNTVEVEEVGGAREQVSGFLYYLMTGKIIFKEDDGSTTVYQF